MLCFRLFSVPVAIPQVLFLVKVICPLLSCLVLWSDSAENCGFSAVAVHRWSSTLTFVLQRHFRFQVVDAPVLRGVQFLRWQKTAAIPLLQFITVLDTPFVAQLLFSMVLATMEIPQLRVYRAVDAPVMQVVHFRTSSKAPCIWQSLVRCSVFPFGVQGYGIFWEISSECFPCSILFGSTVDTRLASVYEAFWKNVTRAPSYFSAMLVSTADSCFMRQTTDVGFAGGFTPRAVLSSLVGWLTMLGIMAGVVRMDSYALGSDMFKAGIAGGNASRAVFAGMRSRLFGALCIGAWPGRSCPQGHGPHN